MAEYPALPLWTDAYLADTSHLTDAEHGRYMLLLIHLWRAPMQRFPNDDAWLARKFGRSEQDFVLQWKPVMQEFMQNTGNWWMQKRLSAEWLYVSQLSQKRRDAAKSRWNKEKVPCKSNAPTPTPTPTPLKKDKRAIATRWHPDCKVSSEWLGDAQVARLRNALPEIDVLLEAEKFANFWSSKSGANATKLDWHKTWINWALKAEAPRHGHGSKPTAHDKFFAAGLSLIVNNGAGAEGGSASQDEQDNSPDGPGRPLLPP